MNIDSQVSDTGSRTRGSLQDLVDQLRREVRFLNTTMDSKNAELSMVQSDLTQAQRVVAVLVRKLGGEVSITDAEWSSANGSDVISMDDPTRSTMTLVCRPA